MSNEAMVAPLSGTITVGVPVERAFRVFTESFNTWWPAEYHIGTADVAEAVLEPKEGGRWFNPRYSSARILLSRATTPLRAPPAPPVLSSRCDEPDRHGS